MQGVLLFLLGKLQFDQIKLGIVDQKEGKLLNSLGTFLYHIQDTIIDNGLCC